MRGHASVDRIFCEEKSSSSRQLCRCRWYHWNAVTGTMCATSLDPADSTEVNSDPVLSADDTVCNAKSVEDGERKVEVPEK